MPYDCWRTGTRASREDGRIDKTIFKTSGLMLGSKSKLVLAWAVTHVRMGAAVVGTGGCFSGTAGPCHVWEISWALQAMGSARGVENRAGASGISQAWTSPLSSRRLRTSLCSSPTAGP